MATIHDNAAVPYNHEVSKKLIAPLATLDTINNSGSNSGIQSKARMHAQLISGPGSMKLEPVDNRFVKNAVVTSKR